jgi:protein EFR3
MDKSPRDLPLYARSVLTIIEAVLKAKDITMAEETLPTFEAFCKHQETTSLMANQDRAYQYQTIVKTYANFASKDTAVDSKAPMSTPVTIRWRSVGLQAIKSVVGSESIGADGGKQFTIVMPVVLQNLYTNNEDNIPFLHQRVQASENSEKEQMRKRRMSIATVATVDTVDANPATAAGSTADADKVAEEEVRIIAVRCLKQIFSAGSNRGQIRIATALTLRFIANRNPPRSRPSVSSIRSVETGNWATSLMEMVTRWAPVQDRFIILLTAMETLVRSPIVEENLEKQLTLTTMIDWLLSSTINLIGLSVMDVLLGLVQHSLLLLQLGGKDSKVFPHQVSDTLDLFQDAQETFDNIVPSMNASGMEASQTGAVTASPIRQELLFSLTKCIGSLATHIYYADQISDMIGAILTRLKPSTQSDISSAAIAIENPAATASVIANSGNLQEDPNTDTFFSFATARLTALNAIKDILLVANLRRSLTGSAAESRNRLGLQVWEGTQWLLRDEDRAVRQAYVDALLTWLKLETNKNDLKATSERKPSKTSKRNASDHAATNLTKQAVSNASNRDKAIKAPKSTFLQLLHLAIYDNCIECPEVESDILVAHLLLTNLTEKLGVNAAQYGLPMIFRLQEDIKAEEYFTTPASKINIASLVLGYFWALSEKFDFETTSIGSQLHYEVSRRKKEQLWLEKIRVPPIALDYIRPDTAPTNYSEKKIPPVDSKTLKPYESRGDLVEEIATAYDAALVSPPTSPPTSPGRIFSIPALSYSYGYGAAPAHKPSTEDQLPAAVKEQMLSEWSKESCIAAVERESAKTASLSGSKTGTASAPRNYLAANGNGNESPIGSNAPALPHHKHHMDHDRPTSAAYGLVGGLGSLQKLQRTSSQQGSPTPLASSSRESTVRVTELKRVLSTNVNARHSSPLRGNYAKANSSTESMISADISETDTGMGVPDTQDEPPRPISRDSESARRGPRRSLSLTSHPVLPKPEEERPRTARKSSDEIPPVPPLPFTLNLPGRFPSDVALSTASGEIEPHREPSLPRQSTPPPAQPVQGQELLGAPPGTADSSRAGRSLKRKKSRPGSRRVEKTSGSAWAMGDGAGPDLGALLGRISIEEEDEGAAKGGVIRPPY